jgi:stage III sporulation protein AB
MMGAVGFGYSLCMDMDRNIDELKIEKRMLLYIIGEINYIHRPMEEILDSMSEDMALRREKPFDGFLKDVVYKLNERKGKSLKTIWLEEIPSVSKQAFFYLRRMADCFDCEGCGLQVDSLELLKNDIDCEIRNLEEVKKENGRLIKALSTLTGIMCIVLFL